MKISIFGQSYENLGFGQNRRKFSILVKIDKIAENVD